MIYCLQKKNFYIREFDKFFSIKVYTFIKNFIQIRKFQLNKWKQRKFVQGPAVVLGYAFQAFVR